MDRRKANGNLAYAPKSFTDAILRGGEDIRRHERRKRRLFRLSAAALAVVLAGTLGVVSLRFRRREDVTLAPSKGAPRQVWTHPEDAFYHRSSECRACLNGAVEMQMDTAKEFGKEACAECMWGDS